MKTILSLVLVLIFTLQADAGFLRGRRGGSCSSGSCGTGATVVVPAPQVAPERVPLTGVPPSWTPAPVVTVEAPGVSVQVNDTGRRTRKHHLLPWRR